MDWVISNNKTIKLDHVCLMGILNVTPDSFYDGGLWTDSEQAVDHATLMLEEGADIIDIGGESTKPGSVRVSSNEQIDRIGPVIEQLIQRHPEAILSIDTTKYDVAKAALDLGASIINDVSAGNEDNKIFELVAFYNAGLILMHRVNVPSKDKYSNEMVKSSYENFKNLIQSIKDFFVERLEESQSFGVSEKSVVLDIGLGFGKTVNENFLLMNSLNCFSDFKRPLLCAVSRKSFLGAAINESDPNNRLEASIAAAINQFYQGIRLFRVHDIKSHRQAFQIIERLAAFDSGDNM